MSNIMCYLIKLLCNRFWGHRFRRECIILHQRVAAYPQRSLFLMGYSFKSNNEDLKTTEHHSTKISHLCQWFLTPKEPEPHPESLEISFLWGKKNVQCALIICTYPKRNAYFPNLKLSHKKYPRWYDFFLKKKGRNKIIKNKTIPRRFAFISNFQDSGLLILSFVQHLKILNKV